MSDEKHDKKVKKNNELSEAAAKLGAKGGRIGGPARSRALSHEEKSAIAREGGLARAAKAKAAHHKLKSKKKGK